MKHINELKVIHLYTASWVQFGTYELSKTKQNKTKQNKKKRHSSTNHSVHYKRFHFPYVFITNSKLNVPEAYKYIHIYV